MPSTKEAIKIALRPYDVVKHKDGSVGVVTEVNINSCQPELKHQLSYSVSWFFGSTLHNSWFDHEDLEQGGNIFLTIAKRSCSTGGSRYVKKVMWKKQKATA
jgi:hypothetical protein